MRDAGCGMRDARMGGWEDGRMGNEGMGNEGMGNEE
jgi:hypothetical protein